MRIAYPVIFTRTNDKKDTYLVEIPDIAGITEGYGMPDAIKMARDCIGCKCYDKADKDIPEASSFERIDPRKGEFADAGESFVSMVDIDLSAYRMMMNKKTVRRNVSIPGWLNQAAEENHINVSRVLQDALIEKLGVSAG